MQFSIFTHSVNLDLHLKNHEIISKSTKKRKASVKSAFTEKVININGRNSSNKMIISHLLIKWFARDNLPFSTVQKPGFKTFLTQTGILKNPNDLPSESYLRLYALGDCYNFVKEKVLIELRKMVFGCIQLDMWTDNYARNPFMGFLVSYIDNNWDKQIINLRTSEFPHPHTAKSVKNKVFKILEAFEINPKKVMAVTDNGANILSAFKTIGIRRFSCIGHNMHLLLKADGCDKVEEVSDIIKKLNRIHHAIIYQKKELSNFNISAKQKKIISKIVELGNFAYTYYILFSKK